MCEHKSMLGQLPFLTQGDVKIGHSGAILRYLTRTLAIKPNASAGD